jgi:hypothetical protein
MLPHYSRGGRAALAPQKGKGGSALVHGAPPRERLVVHERARDESVAVFILDLVSPDLIPVEVSAGTASRTRTISTARKKGSAKGLKSFQQKPTPSQKKRNAPRVVHSVYSALPLGRVRALLRDRDARDALCVFSRKKVDDPLLQQRALERRGHWSRGLCFQLTAHFLMDFFGRCAGSFFSYGQLFSAFFYTGENPSNCFFYSIAV